MVLLSYSCPLDLGLRTQTHPTHQVLSWTHTHYFLGQACYVLGLAWPSCSYWITHPESKVLIGYLEIEENIPTGPAGHWMQPNILAGHAKLAEGSRAVPWAGPFDIPTPTPKRSSDDAWRIRHDVSLFTSSSSLKNWHNNTFHHFESERLSHSMQAEPISSII